jgi:membrane fusion protein, multidrug efflux system
MPRVDDEVGGPEAAETVEETAPEERSVSRVKIILPLVLLITAVAAYYAYQHYRDRVSSDDAEVEGHVSAVAPKVAGNVIEVLARDNQPVKAGDVLVRIDPRDYKARVDAAKASLAQAESQLRSARVTVPMISETTASGATAATAQLATAQVDLERAKVSYEQAATADLSFAQSNVKVSQAANDRAQADLARMRPLIAKAEISQQQFDAYTATALMAESQLQAARDKLSSAQQEAAIRKVAMQSAQTRVDQAKAQLAGTEANRRQVDIRTADAGTAAAMVQVARANLEAAELQLSYTTVVAPIDGVVTRKSVEVGQIVQPGQGIMTVVPLQDTWITANFKETQLADVHPGQRAEVHVDMYGKILNGRVDSIAGATGARMSLLPPENATGNFVKVVQRIPVKILVDQEPGVVLRPGMNVNVTIFTK